MNESETPSIENEEETSEIPEWQTGKRFELSKEEFAKQRIKALKNTMEQLKKENPEVLSFTMFGSMARGNPQRASDIDGYLFVDADAIQNSEKDSNVIEQTISRETIGTFLNKSLENQYKEKCAKLMGEKSDLEKEQILQGIKVRPINEKIIDTHLNYLSQGRKEKQKYEEAMTKWINAEPSDRTNLDALIAYQKGKPKEPDIIEDSNTLSEMFHLDVGGGIRKYRSLLISKLENMGEEGENLWRNIIQSTEMMENYSATTEKHYPRSLNEAKEMYGESRQEK